MKSNALVEMFKVVDAMDLIRAERKRLEKITADPKHKENKHQQWMYEWLEKTDDQHLFEKMNPKKQDDDWGYVWHEWSCCFCFAHPRYLLETSFSFCDEYGCGMKLCPECAKKIGELGTKSAVREIVKKYAKNAAPNKKISPHKLRSTYGTELYRETKDIYVVASVLRHRDINTTRKHYADCDDAMRR